MKIQNPLIIAVAILIFGFIIWLIIRQLAKSKNNSNTNTGTGNTNTQRVYQPQNPLPQNRINMPRFTAQMNGGGNMGQRVGQVGNH